LVLISDTHEQHHRFDAEPLPPGDVLVHCGDFTNSGREKSIRKFVTWFASQPHPNKIFIGGNHDLTLDAQLRPGRPGHAVVTEAASTCHYLEDAGCTIAVPGASAPMLFYGSPWQPAFWGAFNLPRGGSALGDRWRQVPAGVDVLLTHTPPHGVLDGVPRSGSVGCELLRHEVVHRVRPRVHVFGHIHEHGGQTCRVRFDDNGGGGGEAEEAEEGGAGQSCLCVNAASCPVTVVGPMHRPVVVFLPADKAMPATVVPWP